MLEEQGHSKLLGVLTTLFRTLGRGIKDVYVTTEKTALKNYRESGRKTVKNLVRKGRDLELSSKIESKTQLASVCKECKKQGIAFAIKKIDNETYQLLYQRKDAALVSEAVASVLKKKLKSQKPSILNILKQNNKIVEPVRAEPAVHREVGIR